ncbi:translation initiation factor IF-2-like isoform X2 [Marmota marmota marmota]|uniref:translation initiation factor IF-2-like isoform X2 n=1 Tax=Marmota marmota marmota TaxID=9994 RepID=UPI00209202A5|nr:translation initiation factor IF-2-like isoform X2 [Marmota marmota marmota]
MGMVAMGPTRQTRAGPGLCGHSGQGTCAQPKRATEWGEGPGGRREGAQAPGRPRGRRPSLPPPSSPVSSPACGPTAKQQPAAPSTKAQGDRAVGQCPQAEQGRRRGLAFPTGWDMGSRKGPLMKAGAQPWKWGCPGLGQAGTWLFCSPDWHPLCPRKHRREEPPSPESVHGLGDSSMNAAMSTQLALQRPLCEPQRGWRVQGPGWGLRVALLSCPGQQPGSPEPVRVGKADGSCGGWPGVCICCRSAGQREGGTRSDRDPGTVPAPDHYPLCLLRPQSCWHWGDTVPKSVQSSTPRLLHLP